MELPITSLRALDAPPERFYLQNHVTGAFVLYYANQTIVVRNHFTVDQNSYFIFILI